MDTGTTATGLPIQPQQQHPGASTSSLNSVFGSLKWWPSNKSSANLQASAAAAQAASASSASASIPPSAPLAIPTAGLSQSLPASAVSLHSGSLKQLQQHHQQQQQLLHPSASVVQQLHHTFGGSSSSSSSAGLSGLTGVPQPKLRESKWFTPDESRVLCAVVESGFVVEIREGQENESTYGVVQFKASKDKKPKPQEIDVFTIRATNAQTAAATGRLLRVSRRTLADLWLRGCTVRIQNFGDREHRPHSEKDIRNQIAFAQKAKQMLWQNSQHFAFWCRYGERQQDVRRKQVDSMRYKLPLGIVH